ncbi:hypothetical protein CFN78_27330 [Amycolatopsis antarctica]|uniref:Uncharacterized protein n=2 Tax=Amycolatopsis antarctica TaxID=1854586 RepID=A0A263CXJ0_9PSEU|nr:hypothetical protein CFN78_27330 [Amycolatopsis antarctica]
MLPSDSVARPGNLPRYCTRHGRPATRRKDFALQSKVRIEGRRIFANVFSQTERLAQHASKVRVIDVKGWPLCAVCVRTRTSWLAVASALFFGGLAALVGSLAVGAFTDGMQWLAAVAVGGFVLMPLAAFPFVRGSMGRLIGAMTSPDGESVIVENPSAAFLAELPDHRS